MRAVDIAAKNDRQAVVDFFKEKYNLEPRSPLTMRRTLLISTR
jgi:hypothetical protein